MAVDALVMLCHACLLRLVQIALCVRMRLKQLLIGALCMLITQAHGILLVSSCMNSLTVRDTAGFTINGIINIKNTF